MSNMESNIQLSENNICSAVALSSPIPASEEPIWSLFSPQLSGLSLFSSENEFSLSQILSGSSASGFSRNTVKSNQSSQSCKRVRFEGFPDEDKENTANLFNGLTGTIHHNAGLIAKKAKKEPKTPTKRRRNVQQLITRYTRLAAEEENLHNACKNQTPTEKGIDAICAGSKSSIGNDENLFSMMDVFVLEEEDDDPS